MVLWSSLGAHWDQRSLEGQEGKVWRSIGALPRSLDTTQPANAPATVNDAAPGLKTPSVDIHCDQSDSCSSLSGLALSIGTSESFGFSVDQGSTVALGLGSSALLGRLARSFIGSIYPPVLLLKGASAARLSRPAARHRIRGDRDTISSVLGAKRRDVEHDIDYQSTNAYRHVSHHAV